MIRNIHKKLNKIVKFLISFNVICLVILIFNDIKLYKRRFLCALNKRINIYKYRLHETHKRFSEIKITFSKLLDNVASSFLGFLILSLEHLRNSHLSDGTISIMERKERCGLYDSFLYNLESVSGVMVYSAVDFDQLSI